MPEAASNTPSVPAIEAAPAAPAQAVSAPKSERRPELGRIVERNWPRVEEAFA